MVARPGDRRRRVAVVALVALLCLVVPANAVAVGGPATAQIDPEEGPAVGGPIEIEQVQQGNLFAANETPRVRLAADGVDVAWTLRNYYGRIVASGTDAVDGERTVDLPVDAVGHYTLRVRPAGTGPSSTARTTLAVLPAGGVENDDPFFAMSTKFGTGLDRSMIDVLDRIGVAAVRDEHGWHAVERARGEYDFSGSQREGFMTELRERGFDRLFLAAYANALYVADEQWEGIFTFPFTDAQRQAYANFTVATLRQYPQLRHVEVWNEPNIDSFSVGPAETDPEAYAALLETTYDAVQAERPNATVVGGSATADYGAELQLLDEAWWAAMLAAGGARHADALAVHLYRQEPTAFDRDVDRLRDLTREHTDGEALPLWVTELGWHTSPHGAGGDLETRQARHLIQSHARLRTLEVARYYWYTQVDTYYDEPAWQEAGGSNQAGLLRSEVNPLGPYTPKPALLSYAGTARHLGGTEPVEHATEPVEHHRFAAAEGGAAGDGVSVLWTDERTEVTVSTTAPVTVASPTGRDRTLQPVDGEVYLTVGPDPLFVDGPVDDVTGGAPVDIRTATATGSDTDAATVTADADLATGQSVTHAVGDARTTLERPESGAASAALALGDEFGERAGVAVDVVSIDGQPVGRLEAPVGAPHARFGERPFLTGLTVETMNTGDQRSFAEVNDVGTGGNAWSATQRRDVACYRSDVESGTAGRTLFVDLSNDHYFQVAETVPVTVRYFDDGEGSFGIEFHDGSGHGASSTPVELDGGGWETHTFDLTGASLSASRGALGGGGSHDLRLTLEGSLLGVSEGDVCVESIAIGTAAPGDIDPTSADGSDESGGADGGEAGASSGAETGDDPGGGSTEASDGTAGAGSDAGGTVGEAADTAAASEADSAGSGGAEEDGGDDGGDGATPGFGAAPAVLALAAACLALGAWRRRR